MKLKKVQKQGTDERTQEDYPTSAVYFCRCRVVFLRSFISALFLYLFSSIPTWNEVSWKLVPLVCCAYMCMWMSAEYKIACLCLCVLISHHHPIELECVPSVCMHLCACVWQRMHTRLFVHVRAMFVCLQTVWLWAHAYMCVFVCTCVCLCAHVRTCV